MNWIYQVKKLGACEPSMKWIASLGDDKSFATAWFRLRQPEWLVWLALAVGVNKKVVVAALLRAMKDDLELHLFPRVPEYRQTYDNLVAWTLYDGPEYQLPECTRTLWSLFNSIGYDVVMQDREPGRNIARALIYVRKMVMSIEDEAKLRPYVMNFGNWMYGYADIKGPTILDRDLGSYAAKHILECKTYGSDIAKLGIARTSLRSILGKEILEVLRQTIKFNEVEALLEKT